MGIFAFSSVHVKCLVLFVSVAELLADLSLPSSGNIDAAEDRIVSCLRAKEMGTIDDELQDDSVMTTWMRISKRLGLNRLRILALKRNSISSLFICESVEELRLLREHYDSWLIKKVLQELFTVLVDEPVEISRLEWTEDQYDSCVHHFGMLYVMLCNVYYPGT